MAQVAECLQAAKQEGDYAETNVVGLFRLHDGRYALLTGWCDTTGWGCQDGGSINYASSLEEALTYASDSDRALLVSDPVRTA